MEYEVIIGLETHVQMKTRSKMFCSCANAESDTPNTNVCPVCMGHPGTLPVLNEQALLFGVRTALALDCAVAPLSKFDRKNYFYPDLPKGYQISQYDEPIGRDGKLIVALGDERKRIGIERLHLEEDAAKLLHGTSGESRIDFNRAGAPLMEIVTKPDMRSAEEAKVYLQELRLIMQYLGVSDADMEKGQLRCDANISLRPKGETKLYPKTEIKNMNSFRNVERAISYEIDRQRALWEEGTPVDRLTTRRFDASSGETHEMRGKEEAQDYRYFPEPDIPPLTFTETFIEDQRASLPELPDAKRKRFMEEFGLGLAEVVTLTASPRVADFFEAVISEGQAWIISEGKKTITKNEFAKLASNWITTELFRLMKADGLELDEVKVTPENMAELLKMVKIQEINSSAAQELLATMVREGGDPSMWVEKLDLRQVSDEGAIETAVEAVIAAHAGPVADYRKGKQNALQFLIGMVMKETKGKANPTLAAELLIKKLS